jgi:hypothetical protein
MSRLFGKRHMMVDPEGRSAPTDANPISSQYVYVNSTRLCEAVKRAYDMAMVNETRVCC